MIAAAAMRAKRRARERGIALVMVLGAIAVLTVMLADFQDDTSADLASALADRDGVQAEYMARSAVNLARLLIATEPTIRQAITPLFMFLKRTPPQLPVWEFSDQLLGAFNDQESANGFASTLGIDLSLGKHLGMPGGHFELVIVDEDAKIDCNLGASNDIAHIRLAKELMGLIAPMQYNPLFEQRDSQGQFHDRIQTCQAIIDWADVDESGFNCDMTQSASAGAGVEDAYYQLLAKPYRRKNAPYDSLDELHMVNGVTDDFWATFVDPEPTNPKKRVVTVWGQGAVNVNTANAQTLLGVVCAGAPLADICTDANQAAMFLMGVTMARGITMGAPLFGSPNDFVQMMTGKGMLGPMLTMIGMKPVKFLSESEFAKSITTESKMFSIYAVGVVKGYKRETRLSIHAVVDFRNAPALTQSAGAGIPGVAGGSTTPANPPAATSTSSTTANDKALQAAMQPSTGGTVLYYHIE
jgi:general secretion pathway protein K